MYKYRGHRDIPETDALGDGPGGRLRRAHADLVERDHRQTAAAVLGDGQRLGAHDTADDRQSDRDRVRVALGTRNCRRGDATGRSISGNGASKVISIAESIQILEIVRKILESKINKVKHRK